MTEPTIVCPSCKSKVKLTESLAAPLIEATRKEFEQRIAKKESEIEKREASLAKAKESLDEQIEEKLVQERTKIAAEEAKKAKLTLAADLRQKDQRVSELEEVLKQREGKLADAQKAQAELIRKQRELDDAKREFDLTVEKRVQEGSNTIREKARNEVEEQMKLKVLEKEQTITSMQKQIEELKRKSEQGSQKLQGDVQELELETLLKSKFPIDSVERVPIGEHGGDVVHDIANSLGQTCGKILWETKRTKSWNDAWLVKLREDQRAAKAELAIIISHALPKGVETFDLIDGVWVVHPRLVIPIATILRQTLLDISTARQASEGQQTKMELVYQYLTGPRFRQRVQAIVESFSSMQEDLDKEKKVFTKQWAKREEQIARVMESTVGMYGDLQGIAGKSLQEIEGLELSALNPPTLNTEDMNRPSSDVCR